MPLKENVIFDTNLLPNYCNITAFYMPIEELKTRPKNCSQDKNFNLALEKTGYIISSIKMLVKTLSLMRKFQRP